jgi:peptide/nickel transport system substrate-binding protein
MRGRPSRRTLAAALTAAAIAALAAMTFASGSSATAVLRVGIYQPFQNTNPFNAFEVPDYDVLTLTYPYLIQYNSKGQVIPDLATSWNYSDGGRTWTFHLRSGAKWSDGQPMTSADVAWTLDTIIKYQNGGAADLRENVAGMTSVVTPNATTVVLHYKTPTAAVLSFMNNTVMLPKHIWEKYTGGKDGADLKTFKNSFPDVSGGPYTGASFNGTNFVTLKANPYWYGQKPGAQEVGIEYFTSPDALLQALKNKQIDYANNLPDSNAALVRSYGLDVNEYPSVQYLSLYINAAPKAPHQELRNQLVRQAIDVALDRKQMVSVGYPGSQIGESVVTPGSIGWWDAAVKPTFDAAKANQLLDQAGFKKGSNGIRVANGHPMSYTVIEDSSLGGAADRVFQIIQQNLKAIGIQVTLKPLDPAAFLAADYGTNNTYNTFDLALETNAALLDPGYDLIYFDTVNLGSYNWSGFSNKQYDALYNQQSETANPAARKKLVFKLQVLAQKLVPAAILLYTETVDAHQKTWTGFGANPYGSFNPITNSTFTSIHPAG